jgi:hypothetical protein
MPVISTALSASRGACGRFGAQMAVKPPPEPRLPAHRILWMQRHNDGTSAPDLPTPRSTLRSRYACVLVWCKACRRQKEADL